MKFAMCNEFCQGWDIKRVFEQLKPFANEGQWKTTFHLGWNLYGCLVGEDNLLASQTYDYIIEHTTAHPHYLQYFTAYCLLKAYERTQDDQASTFAKCRRVTGKHGECEPFSGCTTAAGIFKLIKTMITLYPNHALRCRFQRVAAGLTVPPPVADCDGGG